MRKFAVPLSLLLLVLILQGAKYGLRYAAPNILPPTEPISKVVVIYESDVKDARQHWAQGEVMVGRTAQALRKVDKYRQYDQTKDNVPADWKDLLERAKAGQTTTDTWNPWLGVYHNGKKLTWDGPVPDSDAGLKQIIDGQGGM